jgi:hypothetical protein
LAIVARPGQDLAALAADVRGPVAATVRRVLRLDLASVLVVFDGVGA